MCKLGRRKAKAQQASKLHTPGQLFCFMSQQLGKNVERLGKPNKSTTLSFTGIVGEEYGHIHDENKGYSNKTNNGCSKKREEFKGILVLQQN